MKARFPIRLVVALALGLVAAGAVPAWAQPPRTPPGPNTPRTMVQVFASADKVVGPEASDELRDRLIRAFPSRDRKSVV